MRHLSLNLKTISKYLIFDPNNSELFKTTNKLNDFYLSLKTRKTYQNQAVASILNKLCSMGLKIWMITFLNNIRHMCRKKSSYEWVITIRMHGIWRKRQIRHSHFIIFFSIFFTLMVHIPLNLTLKLWKRSKNKVLVVTSLG